MTPAARSMMVFGLYLLGLGALLVFAPNVLLGLFGMPHSDEVWIRVVGVLAGVLGAYYLVACTRSLVPLYGATVIARTIVFIVFAALAMLKLGPPQLVLFGAIDLLGALWTWRALRYESR